jgi:hypothetical protein
MGRVKSWHGEKRILKQVLLSESDVILLKQMIAEDDSELSPFLRRLVREEAQRRGLVTGPQTAIITKAY